MLLTRVGSNSKLIITGDTEQSDLFLRGEVNGLQDVINKFSGKLPEIVFHELGENDCVRSDLVAKIERIYRNKK
jgi:phosphate starvation-inducible PhoH-like protein